MRNISKLTHSLQAREQADGRICVVKESKVDSLERDQVCNKGARHNSLFAFCFQKMSSKPLYWFWGVSLCYRAPPMMASSSNSLFHLFMFARARALTGLIVNNNRDIKKRPLIVNISFFPVRFWSADTVRRRSATPPRSQSFRQLRSFNSHFLHLRSERIFITISIWWAFLNWASLIWTMWKLLDS